MYIPCNCINCLPNISCTVRAYNTVCTFHVTVSTVYQTFPALSEPTVFFLHCQSLQYSMYIPCNCSNCLPNISCTVRAYNTVCTFHVTVSTVYQTFPALSEPTVFFLHCQSLQYSMYIPCNCSNCLPNISCTVRAYNTVCTFHVTISTVYQTSLALPGPTIQYVHSM